MHSQSPALNSLPGPKQPVDLSVSADTLAVLASAVDEYGSVVAFDDTKRGPTVFLNSAEHVNTLLIKKHRDIRKGSDFERVRMLLGNGIIVNDGDLWRRHRRALQPAFTRRRLVGQVVIMDTALAGLLARWQASAAAHEPVDVNTDMSRFALEVILRALFSDDYERHFDEHDENPFRFLSEEFARDLRAVTRLRGARETVQVIADRRRADKLRREDFLDELLFGEPSEAAALSDKEIIDEVMTLVVAGYETSAATLTWAWFELAQRPRLCARLRAEVAAAQPLRGDAMAWLKALPLLQGVLHETLRLYPPVWLFSRKTSTSVDINGMELAEGTTLMISPYLLHRHPAHWAEPEAFNAERFAHTPENSAYIPFSLGPRRCIGEYFAMLEMCRHLALMLEHFNPVPANNEAGALSLGINLRPGQSVSLTLESVNGNQHP